MPGTAQTIYSIDKDGSLDLWLHEGQQAAWDSTSRFTFVLAGTQSGKTSYGPWHLVKWINEYGAGDYLAVTATFDLFKLKLLPELQRVFEHILGIGRYWAGDRIMELKNPATGKFEANRSTDPMWGRIILRSAESGSGLESSSALAAWLDECGQDSFTIGTFEAVLRRLSLSEGPVLGTTTLYNAGWTKTEIYDRWLAGDPNYRVIQFHSKINPAFPEAEQERARLSMPSWRYRMFYEGEFSKPAGLIYEDFDEAFHVCQPFDVPRGWPVYFGHDFGGANTAVVWLAHDTAADRFFVIRESLDGGKSTREHVRDLRLAVGGLNNVAAWGGAPSEDQFRRDWGTEGWEIQRPPIKDVEPGIDRVTQLLKERRVQVFKTCKGLLDEFGTYRRKLDVNGQPTEEIENKRAFHRLDALRYLASALVQAPGFVGGAAAVGERAAGWIDWEGG